MEGLKNWKSTALGAALAVLYYLGNVGAALPKTGTEWFHLIIGALIIGLGYVVQDAGIRVPPGKLAVVPIASLLLLAGCATGTPGTPEYQDPLQALNNVVTVDLDAADAIAVAHNDVIAHACFPVLKKYLGTATPSTDQIKGVISAFEKARVTRLAIEGQVAGGIPTDLKMGCAPLLMDERLFLIRLGLLAGGAIR